MQKPFWVVWCENEGNPTYKHSTRSSAEREAERLARENKGRRFHVLQVESTFEVKDVIRTDYQWNDSDDVPF